MCTSAEFDEWLVASTNAAVAQGDPLTLVQEPAWSFDGLPRDRGDGVLGLVFLELLIVLGVAGTIMLHRTAKLEDLADRNLARARLGLEPVQ